MTGPTPAGQAGLPLSLEAASQAESLDQIEAIGAAHVDAPGAGAPGAAAPGALQLQAPNAVLIADTLKTARKGFCTLTGLNAPAAVLSDAACDTMGREWGAWCDKRQITLGRYLGQHHDTYLLAVSTAALAFALVQATRAELALRRPVEVKTRDGFTSNDAGQADQDQAGPARAHEAAAAPAPASSAATFVGGGA